QGYCFHMEQRSHNIDTSASDLLRTIFADESENPIVVRPGKDIIEALCEVLKEIDTSSGIRLLAQESVLKDIRQNFRTASAVADLIEDGTLSIRTSDESSTNSLVITD